MKIVWFFLFIVFSLASLFIGVQDFDLSILLISRFPRLLSALVTGASLSISGMIMQTITRNKFVSASTAGTMEWCKLGVLVSLLLFGRSGSFVKMMIAFGFAMVGNLLFMKLLKSIKLKDPVMVPLLGMMLGSVVGAITTYFAYQFDLIQNISSWLMGSFSLVVKGNYEVLYLGIPFLIIAYFYADKFTISGMGDSFATSLGLNQKKITSIGLGIVAMISTIIVVSIGSIPFVGMIIPNLVSIYRGDSIKKNLFHNAFFGALFVLACDVVGRILIFPYEIPVSVTISVIGSLIFLVLIFKKNK